MDRLLRLELLPLALLLVITLPVHATSAAPVGGIEAEPVVSPHGSLRYRIPIPVAAGLNGLQPGIALEYDSALTGGDAGPGWRLSGFSTISRCPSRIDHDGARRAVRFDAGDRYCLDGVPLRLVAGQHGQAGAEYRATVHREQRITAHGNAGGGTATGPAWFEVEHPDGMVYRYGHAQDARVRAAGRDDGAVLAWALDEIRDRFGARIHFSYSQDAASGEHLPLEVRWTTTGGQGPAAARYRLRLTWVPQPSGEGRSGFRAGSHYTRAQRLAAIRYEYRAAAAFEEVQRHELEYGSAAVPGSTQAPLVAIRRCAGDQCLAPTLIDWNPRAGGWAPETTAATGVGDGRWLFGDFTGGGRGDLLIPQSGQWRLWPARATGTPYGAAEATGISDAGGTVTVLDKSGDGLADLLVETGPGSGQWRYWRNDGGRFVAGPLYDFGSDARALVPLDLDGDGLDDLVYVTGRGSAKRLMIARNSGGSFAAPVESTLSISSWAGHSGSSALPARTGRRPDFDGDGRQDLLFRISTSLAGETVSVYLGFRSTGEDFESIARMYSPEAATAAIITDINGDGLTDLVYQRHGVRDWRVLLSDGSERTEAFRVPSCSGPQLTGGLPALARMLDYTGDGRGELLLADAGGWHIYRAREGCFHPDGQVGSLAGGSSPATLGTVAITDVNGNGLGDVLLLRQDGQVRLRRRLGSGAELPWRITDGMGNIAIIGWGTLGDPAVYAARDDAPAVAHSRLLLSGTMRVVRWIWHGDAGGLSHSEEWRYLDAWQHLHGAGFLGFRATRRFDDRDGTCSESGYRLAPPYTGRLARHAVYGPGSACSLGSAPAQAPLREYSADWAELADAAPGLVVLAGDEERWYDLPGAGGAGPVRTRRRLLEHDAQHAAIRRETIEAEASGAGGGTWRTTIDYLHEATLRAQYWCLGIPSQVMVTRQAPDGTTASRTLRYGYDGQNRCRPASERSGPPDDPSRQLLTRFTRDTAGRLTRIIQSVASGEELPREVRIAWDDTGLRPASIRLVIPGEPDPVTGLSWDHAHGLPLREASPQGLVTEWQYDGFGRETRRSGPGGSAVLTTRELCGQGCWTSNGRAHHRVREQHAEGYWSEQLLDARGRLVGVATALPGAAAGYREFEHDALGRLRRASRPYLAGGPRFWTVFEHDLHGRLVRRRDPGPEDTGGELETHWSWQGNVLTLEDPEQRRTSYWHDAEGRHWLVQGPLGGGAIYRYGPFGELREIIDPGYHSSTMQHDEAGRPVRISRPDAGTRLLRWNVFGELVAMHDEEEPARVTRWYRDPLGRLIRRTEPEGETRWLWQRQAGGGFGLLQQVTGPGFSGAEGYRRSITYDALSRPREITTVIDGRSYQTSFEHDASGRRTSMTSPATLWGARMSFAWEYSDSGHLARVSQRFGSVSVPVWEAIERDAAGRASRVSLGNGAVIQEQRHDRASDRLRAVRSTRTGNVIQDYRYAWDGSGNLAQRDDLVANRSETFTHDALNRLTTVTPVPGTALQLTYSPSGNLLYRSDAGHLSYLGTGPHAVSSLSGGSAGNRHYGYDTRGNMNWRAGGRIHWTSYDLPREINRLGDACSGDCSRFSYGPARERTVQWLRRNGELREIHYVGPHFEAEYLADGRQSFRLNIEAEGRTVQTQTLDSDLNWDAWFVLRDHLGSVDRLVRNFGNQARDLIGLAYQPFGGREGADDWEGRAGFTGHEHLDHLGLIHMRGRLMDPQLGRMLSPDPFPGVAAWPQSLNPYSYAWNAPLRMVDPDGFEAVDLANYRPDPVSFDFRSVRDPLADAAERWTVAWGSLALGAGIGQFTHRLYRGWAALDPSWRQLSSTVALEVAQGMVLAALPLGDERPDVPLLPETSEYEQLAPRDPAPISSGIDRPDPARSSRIAAAPPPNSQFPALQFARPPLWYAPLLLPDRIQYSFMLTPSNMLTRSVGSDAACQDCHAEVAPAQFDGQHPKSRLRQMRERRGTRADVAP